MSTDGVRGDDEDHVEVEDELGGDAPCWAHLFPDDPAPVTPAAAAPSPSPSPSTGGERPGSETVPRADSILRSRQSGRRGSFPTQERPTHPVLAATLLMVGVVVLLALIAVQPLIGR